MIQNENMEQESSELVIGEFTPKRKFINFISSINGIKVRLNQTSAFIKGKKLSGMLENVVFKITICDKDTINFEEVDTTITDKAMRQRLIDEIDSMDVTGYALKYVVAGLDFYDIDDNRCYLEVDEQKPIDRLRNMMNPIETETKLSSRGMDSLLKLLGGDDNCEILTEEDDNEIEEVCECKQDDNDKYDFIKEKYKKEKEDKRLELLNRLSKHEKEVITIKNSITTFESKLKKQKEDIELINDRLDSFSTNDEQSGYVFNISEEIKSDIQFDESCINIITKITNLLKIDSNKLIEHMKEGYYIIKLAKKDDINNTELKIETEIYDKINSIDVFGKMTLKNDHFEYRGDFDWHKLVNKMLRNGFEQDPDFDKLCSSNSYDSHTKNDDIDSENLNEKSSEVEDNKDPNSECSDFTCEQLMVFDEPTDLVILGSGADDVDNADISITDDETDLDIYINGDNIKIKMMTDGLVNILTIDEYKEWLSSNYSDITIGDDERDFYINAKLLIGFKGEIGVGAKNQVTGEYFNKYNPKKYTYEQDGFDDENDDDNLGVFINLPENTKIYDIPNFDLSKVPEYVNNSIAKKSNFTCEQLMVFDEPTDLVILGCDVDGDGISICDDFVRLRVYKNGVDIEDDAIETEGFTNILTVEEYKKWLHNADDDSINSDGYEVKLIIGFKGEIGLGAKNKVTGEYFNEYNPKKYTYEQDGFDYQNDYLDVFINLPENTILYDVFDNNLNSVPEYKNKK